MTDSMDKVLELLAKEYPNAVTTLNYETSFQLLVATILSAQCTDKRVNQVTRLLFKEIPDAQAFAQLTPEELAPWIKSCGLYRNKSKNIVKTSKIIIQHYNGKVPETEEELMGLPGVGRKTANVILSNAFNKPAIAVDTHVFRVAHRLGISKGSTPLATERDLEKVIPKEKLSEAHHWFIYHGRNVCKARKPFCDLCTLNKYCQYN